MLGIKLNKLKISSVTHDGIYSTEIPFNEGLNVIRAENSSGKSTCINAIAYALGLDPILGPSRGKPFPRSMHNFLESSKCDSTPHYVKESYVELQLTNSLCEEVSLFRFVEGNKDKITVTLKNGDAVDYFLGNAGTVGSSKSEMGFHYWLEKYIGWKLPQLTTHDGKPTRLYLECIFPLFFIEQKRGWSEIQANTPTFYGIKGVKKAALEFCLGVESYKRKNRISELSSLLAEQEKNWESLVNTASSLAEFGGLKFQLENTLSNDVYFPLVAFKVSNQDKLIDLDAYLSGLRITLNEISRGITQWPNYDEVTALTSRKRSLRRELSSNTSRQESILISLDNADKKIQKLETELDRYKQLKRLQDVGSDVDFEIEISSCPVCESEMYDSLAKAPEDSRPLSVEENISYLKNQVDFYKGIKNRQKIDLGELSSDILRLKNSILEVQHQLDSLKSDEAEFLELYGHEIKRKVELDKEIHSLTKLEEKQRQLNEKARAIHELWQKYNNELSPLKNKKTDDVAFQILSKLKSHLIANLQEFGYKTANLQFLQISEQTLRPELDGYDIVADSSASDYIRIIWSYTLALLELGIEEKSVKHGGFVVFDEPRQHETDKASFSSLLQKSSSLIDSGGQVIVATSISEDELSTYELEDATMTIFSDGEYILKKEK
ncbi:hypothetical protein ACQKDY_16250 [Alteromonas macleodii]|uniref:hypothetical protein n=1 Tax=Alteromonas macleodii TaxID=28108 RepID=UPI003D078C92